MKRQAALEERFWPKVNKSGECWEWTASITTRGYGQIGAGAPSRGSLLAHRVSYELANGPILEGLVIDHKCHNRACVNPDHLQAVSQKQNCENQGGLTVNNTSGARGVFYHKKTRKYEVRVGHNGKLHYAGLYPTQAEAEAAAIAKRNELFTNNLADRAA